MSMRFIMSMLVIATMTWPSSGAKQKKVMDTFASVDESEWFNPLENKDKVDAFIETWGGTRRYHALDLFGASRAVQRCWERRGFCAAALDIQLDDLNHDILTMRGWFCFLDHIMQTLPHAVCVCGPPCSLFIWISSGTHRRCSSMYDIYGNVGLKCVRMSNAILRNFAYLVEVSHSIRQSLFWIVEQPTSSKMFALPEFRPLLALWRLTLVTTWLGCFGHVLQKGTKLLCNLGGCEGLKRKMTKKQKAAVARRRARLAEAARKRGQEPACYYKIDSQGRVSGGRDLPSTAHYPAAFISKLYGIWLIEFQRLSAADNGLLA